MIKHKMVKQRRLFFYKDEWRSTRNLCLMPECVVKMGTLTQRLSQAITNSQNSNWSNIKQCLITELTQGPGVKVKERTEFSTYFIDLMMAMPVNNLKPRIMQSK